MKEGCSCVWSSIISADVFDCTEGFRIPRMRSRVPRQDKDFSTIFKPSLEMAVGPLYA